MKQEDIILAFFPCIRFEDQIIMCFNGVANQLKNKTITQKLEYDLQLHEELHHNYTLITKLALICIKRGLKLIIENPYSTQHYLYRYWALKPAFIDYDRTEMGDSFKKPTQYWFINFKPSYNLVFEAQVIKPIKKVDSCNKVERSMISPEYANRFIREFILTKEQFEIINKS